MNFGVIGTNFISKEFIKAGSHFMDFNLSAVCSRKEETALRFIEDVGRDTSSILAFTSPEEMAQSSLIDAVYIATPNICHFGQAGMMLQNGKHVFLEKPAVLSEMQFNELKKLADDNNLVLMEGMRTVYTPGFLKVKETMGRLGRIRRASLTYCQYSRRYDNYKKGIIENAFNPSLGNGALMDIGVYLIASITALLGKPEKVTSEVMKLDNGLDYQGAVFCMYPGIIADLSYGKVSDSMRWSEIQGEAGSLVYFPPTNPKQVILKLKGQEPETVYSDNDDEFYGMKHEVRAFLNFIKQKNDKSWNGCEAYSLAEVQEQTFKTLSVMDTIRNDNGILFCKSENYINLNKTASELRFSNTE